MIPQRKPLPPGWEEYEFTDEDGVAHPAAMLRRKLAKATWREAWLEEIANEERFFAEAEKVLVGKGHADAALVLRKIGASARAGKRGWLRRNTEDGMPIPGGRAQR